MKNKNNKPEIEKIGSIDALTITLFKSNKNRIFLCVNEERALDHYLEIGQYSPKENKVQFNKKNLKNAVELIYKHFGNNIQNTVEKNIKKYFENKK